MPDGNGGDHAQEKGRDFVDKVRSVCNKILRKCHKTEGGWHICHSAKERDLSDCNSLAVDTAVCYSETLHVKASHQNGSSQL